MKRLLALLCRGVHGVGLWLDASAAGLSTDFIDLRLVSDQKAGGAPAPESPPAARAATTKGG